MASLATLRIYLLWLRMQNCSRRATLDAQDENIVGLAELLRCGGDICRGGLTAKHLLDALEAEEFSVCILSFDDAVGHNYQGIAGFEFERGNRKIHPWKHPQWKRTFNLQLLAIEIGRKLTGIGQLDGSARRATQDHAGPT